jgi:hypothetical protein
VAAPRNLDGLIAWTRREDWREPLAPCLDRHTAKACAAAGIDPAEIEDLLGTYAASTVWGAAFEDLLATDLPDGRSPPGAQMKIALMISRSGQAQRRPRQADPGGRDSRMPHSASVTSLASRRAARLCCARVVAVHTGLSSNSASTTRWSHNPP